MSNPSSSKIDTTIQTERGDKARVRLNNPRSGILLSLDSADADYVWVYLSREQAQSLAKTLLDAASVAVEDP